MSRMVIESSVRQAGNDPIFRVAGEAAKRIAEVGKEAVTNSTIGALMDDDGNLVAFKTVYDTFKSLPNSEIANYAAIAGIPEFKEKVLEACFKSHRPQAYLRAVATPGGTGAIRHAICNYSEFGDKILVPDWHWAPYGTIANENRRSLTSFVLFNENGSFNMAAYQEAVLDLLKKQGRVLSIMNTPAHNPTGYSITDDEWQELKAFYTQTALANPDRRIIILCDIAYIDFAGQGEDARKFMEILTGMPDNVLVLYAFSASKGFTMYGLRNGAIICAAPNEVIADEFEATCAFSNRGTWSNGTRGAMKTLATIFSDDKLKQAFEAEQDEYKALLQGRAKAFVKAASECGLEICDYHDGFFISIPCENAAIVGEKLMKENLFVVALKKGIRFAPCAVSEAKCSAAPALIKKAMAELQ